MDNYAAYEGQARALEALSIFKRQGHSVRILKHNEPVSKNAIVIVEGNRNVPHPVMRILFEDCRAYGVTQSHLIAGARAIIALAPLPDMRRLDPPQKRVKEKHFTRAVMAIETWDFNSVQARAS